MNTSTFVWILRILVAVGLGWASVPKFLGSSESREVFETLGAEPYGRFLTGVLEIIAAVILLVPGRARYGATLGIALMAGAIGVHVYKLGFEGEMGIMAGMALLVLIVCVVIVYLGRPK